MKNLTKSLIAASFLLAGSASAVDDITETNDGLIVKGHVPVKCVVEVGEGEIDMLHNPAVGETFTFGGDINFQCNSKLGANIDLLSENGGLNVDGGSTEHVIDYSAWLEIVGLTTPTMGGIGGNFVELVNKDGSTTANTLMTGEKDMALAMPGMVTGALSLRLTEQIKFAGEYEDTLTVAISAKL